jgi:aryl carrier-like protein
MALVSGMIERSNWCGLTQPYEHGAAMRSMEAQLSLATDQHALESELLLETARVAIDEAARDRILRLCQKEINWSVLIRAAKLHGLAPLVYWHLKSAGQGFVPADAMQVLAESFMANTVNCAALSVELIELSDQFKAHGMDIITFKGPVLAESYYGNFALRPTADLDILIAKGSVSNAYRLLRKLEYSPYPWRHRQLGDQFFQSTRFPNLCHEYTFVKDDGPIFVDLHWQLMPFEFLSLSSTQLVKRLDKCRLLGRDIAAFDDELSLIYLCAHATKHGWSRINWIVDIAQLMDRMQNTNWHSLLELSRAAGAERMVLLGVYLTKYLPLYRPVSELERRTQALPEVKLWGDEIMDRFLNDPTASEWKELKKWTFFLSMKEGWSDKIRLIIQLASRPTLDEWIRLPLPDNLFFLYFLLRPFSLFCENGIRLLWRYCIGGYDRNLNPKPGRN